MIRQYIDAAMRKAKYEILPDDNTYYGEIPECQGVWANEKTLEECRTELESVLEDWMLYRFSKQLTLPVIDNINFAEFFVEEVAA